MDKERLEMSDISKDNIKRLLSDNISVHILQTNDEPNSSDITRIVDTLKKLILNL